MSECRYGSGAVITADDLDRLRTEDCVIERGAVIRLFYSDRTAPDPAPVKHRAERIMDEIEASGASVPVSDAPAAAPVHAVTASTAPAQTPFDLTALTQATGGNGGLTIVLALIAVLFGAAGWKFWQKVSSDHHEYRMKELELKAEAAKAQQHQQCATVHAQHEARLSALEQKVTAVETNSASFDADFDAGDLKKRLVKLEKALKAKPKG